MSIIIKWQTDNVQMDYANTNTILFLNAYLDIWNL